MSGLIEVTQPDTSYTLDSTIFEVQSGASLTLTGSSDTVVLDTGAGQIYMSGINDTLIGSTVSGAWVSMSGSGNVVSVGANSFVGDYSGDGDTITAGSGSMVYAGANSKVNMSGGTIYETDGGSAAVTGAGNTIGMTGNASLSLDGSGNAVSMYLANWTETVNTSTGSFSEQDGQLVVTGSVNPGSITLTGGVATVDMGNGNTVTVQNVVSGRTLGYVDASGTTTSTVLVDSNLVHVGGTLYDVKGNLIAEMNNTIFDVQSGGQLTFTGSSNEFILESGAANVNSDFDWGISISGTGNTVIGASDNNAIVSMSGSGNVVSVGANSFVGDYSGDGDTIMAGSGSTVYAGANSKVNMSGGTIYETDGGSAAVTGAGNTIGMTGNASLSLDGSSNTVSMYLANWTETVNTSTGSFSEQDGQLVVTGSVNPGSITLTGGVATVDMGNGNTVTVQNVASGSTLEYINASGVASFSVLQDSGVDSAFGGGLGAMGQASGAALTGSDSLVAAMAVYAPEGLACTSTLTSSLQPVVGGQATLLAGAYH
jgi:trimeric autotransporter adhesin